MFKIRNLLHNVWFRIFGWPKCPYETALEKATCDEPWDYAIGLVDGSVFRFEGADFMRKGTWVHLRGIREWHLPRGSISYNFDRGIDIPISAIVWVTDAPEGS